MLRIRPATVEDESIYRKHWEDEEFKYQWIWYSEPISETVENTEYDEGFRKTVEGITEREREVIFSDFEKTLQRDRLFIIELDGMIIGSIRFMDYCRGDWRIADWAMELDSDDLKKSIIEKFASLKLPRAKTISIGTAYEPTRVFLLKNGFEEKYRYFFYFQIPKKKSGSHSNAKCQGN